MADEIKNNVKTEGRPLTADLLEKLSEHIDAILLTCRAAGVPAVIGIDTSRLEGGAHLMACNIDGPMCPPMTAAYLALRETDDFDKLNLVSMILTGRCKISGVAKVAVDAQPIGGVMPPMGRA